MTDEQPDILVIICAACKRLLGHGTREQARKMAHDHVDICGATEEQYEQAVFDLKFHRIITHYADD